MRNLTRARCKVQTTGGAHAFAIDKTNGANIWLSKARAALDCHLFTMAQEAPQTHACVNGIAALSMSCQHEGQKGARGKRPLLVAAEVLWGS